jgi:hypothetical protein
MNGSISYKSKVNKGTRFTVTLPLPLYDEVTYVQDTIEITTQLSNLKILRTLK